MIPRCQTRPVGQCSALQEAGRRREVSDHLPRLRRFYAGQTARRKALRISVGVRLRPRPWPHGTPKRDSNGETQTGKTTVCVSR